MDDRELDTRLSSIENDLTEIKQVVETLLEALTENEGTERTTITEKTED